MFVNSQLSLVDPRQATVGKVLSLISSVGSHDSLFLIVWILLRMAKQQVSRQFYTGDHYMCVCVCVFICHCFLFLVQIWCCIIFCVYVCVWVGGWGGVGGWVGVCLLSMLR